MTGNKSDMTSTNSYQNRQSDFSKVGSAKAGHATEEEMERTSHKMFGQSVDTPAPQATPQSVAAHVGHDEAADLLADAENAGAMKPERTRKRQQGNDERVAQVVDDEFAEERLEGESLADYERRRGREAEMEYHREVAVEAEAKRTGESQSSFEAAIVEQFYGDYLNDEDIGYRTFETDGQPSRAAESRAVTSEASARATADFAGRARLARGLEPSADPRAELAPETLGEVNEMAERVTDELPVPPAEAAVARGIAERLARGASEMNAMLNELDWWQSWGSGGPLLAVNIEDWMVEDNAFEPQVRMMGRVETLYDPASPKMKQVGLLADQTGELVKFTIWRGSDCTRVNEGDVIDIHDAKPGRYRGQVTLSCGSDTRIERKYRCTGGASPVGVSVSGGQDTSKRHVIKELDLMGGGSETVRSPEATHIRQERVEDEGFYTLTSWSYPRSVCPEWFIEQHEGEA